MKNHYPVSFACLLAAAILLALPCSGPPARAATFNWGPGAQNITGDSDVSTAGSLVAAFNLGDTGVAASTVNSVLFQSFVVPNGNPGATVGNFALVSGGSFNASTNTGEGTPTGAFAALSSAYKTVLASSFTSFPALSTLTISGLTIGAQYQFQCWMNRSLAGQLRETVTAGGSTVTLVDNVSQLTGGLGQFAIGTFTADATTQVVLFGGPQNVILNAFQLRQVAPAGVPESGRSFTLIIFAMGALLLGTWTYHRCARDQHSRA